MGTYERIDKQLLNLKIISRIPKHGRIRRDKNGIISIESADFLTPFRRYIYSDSREQTVLDLTNIIYGVFSEAKNITRDICQQSYAGKHQPEAEGYVALLESFRALMKELVGSKAGLQNLRDTYTGDVKTTASIDILIEKIDIFLLSLFGRNKTDEFISTGKPPPDPELLVLLSDFKPTLSRQERPPATTSHSPTESCANSLTGSVSD